MIKVLSMLGHAEEVRSRHGLRRFGVPPGGPWDLDSWEALIELGCGQIWEAATTAFSPTTPFWTFESLSFQTLYFLGMSGVVLRNGEPMRMPCCLAAAPGDRFELAAGSAGMRAMVGSESCDGRDAMLESPLVGGEPICFIPALEAEVMEATVTARQDRIGIRLTGEFLPPPPLARSEPSVLGVIQMVEGGLLVHGPEGPTTGGYPRVGVVAQTSLSTLAQTRPGEIVKFQPISLEEAVLRRIERKQSLRRWAGRIKVGLRVE